MRIAQGYNPAMIADREYLQQDCELVELGFHELDVISAKNLRHNFPSLSLHIGRSPISEPAKKQKYFLNFLKAVCQKNNFYSLGFHMCGDRNFDIGTLGFSPPFVYQPNIEENITNFISQVRVFYKNEIWLENANFYSETKELARKNYQFLSKMAKTQNIGIILDISHLLIEANNLNISPLYLLREIAFEYVQETHISGIIIDKNGIFHDGHSQPVSKMVWEFLEIIFHELPKRSFINIEHTDLAFKEKKDCYLKDHEILKKFLKQKQNIKDTKLNPIDYAKSYVCKLLLRQIKNLKKYLETNELTIKNEVEQWYVLRSQQNKSFVLDKSELLLFEKQSVEHLASDFIAYLNQKEKSKC